jgi:hypothetical protein
VRVLERKGPEDRFLRRLEQLKIRRKPWEDEWKNVTKLIFPRRNVWTMSQKDSKGVDPEVYDTVALESLTLMADGLIGNLVPAGVPFFKFLPAISRYNEIPALRRILDLYQEQITGVLNRSNFNLDNGEAFPDACGLGTAISFIEQDPATQRIMFSSRHIKECYIAENRWGLVDTVYREYEMSRENLLDEFYEALDDRQKDKADKFPDNTVKVLHVVEPSTREGVYEETYLLTEEKATTGESLLYQGERQYFPYNVWRFRKNSDEEYGRSPAIDAYWEVSMINNQSKTMAEAAHKAVEPPLLASANLNGHIKQNPRGITYKTNPGDTVQSLYGNGLGQYPLGIDAMDRRAEIIRRHFRYSFFSDLLQNAPGMGREKTATEINAIEAQKAALLGSSIGRVTKERLEPIINTIFNIEDKAGRLPPLPSELRQLTGLGIEVEYIGPLARRLKQYLSAQGLVEGTQIVMGIINGLPNSPQAAATIDLYDWDYISRQTSKANGMPEAAFLPVKTVQQIRKARAEQQAALQQAQLEIEQAKTNPALSKAPEPGSPAERMARK